MASPARPCRLPPTEAIQRLLQRDMPVEIIGPVAVRALQPFTPHQPLDPGYDPGPCIAFRGEGM